MVLKSFGCRGMKEREEREEREEICPLHFFFLIFSFSIDNQSHISQCITITSTITHPTAQSHSITFGDIFSQQLDNSPTTLSHLRKSRSSSDCIILCSYKWITPIKRSMLSHPHSPISTLDSASTTQLILVFGWNFNHLIDTLPCRLTHLTYGDCFDHSQQSSFVTYPPDIQHACRLSVIHHDQTISLLVIVSTN